MKPSTMRFFFVCYWVALWAGFFFSRYEFANKQPGAGRSRTLREANAAAPAVFSTWTQLPSVEVQP